MNTFVHIRKREEFLHVQQNGKRVSRKFFTLLFVLRPENKSPRLGIVAAKKIGNAVVRNRAKRLIRESFRCNQSAFPAQADVVVVCQPGIHLATQSEITQNLLSVAKKVKI